MFRIQFLLMTVFSLGGCVGFYSDLNVPPEDPNLTCGEPLLADMCLEDVIVGFRNETDSTDTSDSDPAPNDLHEIFDSDHRQVLGINSFERALEKTLRESNLFAPFGPRKALLFADILDYDIGCTDPSFPMVFKVDYRLIDGEGTTLFEQEIATDTKNDQELIFAYDRLSRSQTLGYVENIRKMRSGLRLTLTEYAKELEEAQKEELLREQEQASRRMEERGIRETETSRNVSASSPGERTNRTSSVPTTAPSCPHERWALVVGIGNYEDPAIAKIPEAAEDAMAVYDFLLSPDGGGFASDHVFLLMDKNATKLNLERFLKRELKINVLKEDELFIYFACHGVALPDADKKSNDGHEKYLVPYDTKNSEIDLYGLSMSDIERLLDDIDCRQVAVVLDTCFSGGACSLCMGPATRNTTLTSKFLQDLACGDRRKERKILTACDGSELALGDPESGHGVFTTYFIEALNRAEDRDGNGSISLFEIYRYLYRPVQKRSSELGQRQHPQWVGLSSDPFVMKKKSKNHTD